jgi:hypothetical protein
VQLLTPTELNLKSVILQAKQGVNPRKIMKNCSFSNFSSSYNRTKKRNADSELLIPKEPSAAVKFGQKV